MPTLVLLRHAKSAYPDGVADHDRPLSERGLREAPVAGELLVERLPSVDLALVSSGLRAQQTWQAVSRRSTRLGSEALRPVPGDTEELLAVVRHLPAVQRS